MPDSNGATPRLRRLAASTMSAGGDSSHNGAGGVQPDVGAPFSSHRAAGSEAPADSCTSHLHSGERCQVPDSTRLATQSWKPQNYLRHKESLRLFNVSPAQN